MARKMCRVVAEKFLAIDHDVTLYATLTNREIVFDKNVVYRVEPVFSFFPPYLCSCSCMTVRRTVSYRSEPVFVCTCSVFEEDVDRVRNILVDIAGSYPSTRGYALLMNLISGLGVDYETIEFSESVPSSDVYLMGFVVKWRCVK